METENTGSKSKQLMRKYSRDGSIPFPRRDVCESSSCGELNFSIDGFGYDYKISSTLLNYSSDAKISMTIKMPQNVPLCVSIPLDRFVEHVQKFYDKLAQLFAFSDEECEKELDKIFGLEEAIDSQDDQQFTNIVEVNPSSSPCLQSISVPESCLTQSITKPQLESHERNLKTYSPNH